MGRAYRVVHIKLSSQTRISLTVGAFHYHWQHLKSPRVWLATEKTTTVYAQFDVATPDRNFLHLRLQRCLKCLNAQFRSQVK